MKPESTIAEGRKYLRENWEKGVKCPCCTQNVKLYRRRMHSGMGMMLIKLYHLSRGTDRWIHVSELYANGKITTSADYAYLRYWDLLEKKPEDGSEDKKSNGYWRITPKGRRFARNEATELSHILLFNNGFYGLTGDQIDIVEVLGKKFSYSELMNS